MSFKCLSNIVGTAALRYLLLIWLREWSSFIVNRLSCEISLLHIITYNTSLNYFNFLSLRRWTPNASNSKVILLLLLWYLRQPIVLVQDYIGIHRYCRSMHLFTTITRFAEYTSSVMYSWLVGILTVSCPWLNLFVKRWVRSYEGCLLLRLIHISWSCLLRVKLVLYLFRCWLGIRYLILLLIYKRLNLLLKSVEIIVSSNLCQTSFVLRDQFLALKFSIQ